MKNKRIKYMMFALIILVLAFYLYVFAFKNKKSDVKTVVIESGNSSTSDISDSGLSEGETEALLYDTTPVSQAYLNDDTTGLDDFQLEIYSGAVKAIKEVVKEDMTDYEKELAIHDYIVLCTQYDEAALSIFGKASENAENPYGVFLNGQSICSGYTTTFQLIMDMLEIPCKSVFAANKSGEEHAWNMIEIDGEWYYVDVTWDDATPDYHNRPVRHKYFNVTEEYMKLKHEWDSTDLPIAESQENSYIAHNISKLTELKQVLPAMENEIENMNDCVYFEIDDSIGANMTKIDGIDSYYSITKDIPEMEETLNEFKEKYPYYFTQCQRVNYDGNIILAIYMIKTN